MRNQYRIITGEPGAGWVDVSARGRVRLDGTDAVSFLQALVTNDVASLSPGQGLQAGYLTPQGRMLADLEIHHRGPFLLISMAADTASAFAQRLDQLVFSEDVQVHDASLEYRELAVVGVRAAAVCARLADREAAELLASPELHSVDFADGFITRSGEATLPMFKIFVPAGAVDGVAARLAPSGAEPVSAELLEALRVEAGRPRWGAELGPDVIPLEAGLLDRAISTTKGCYVGQEIVIRILHRAHGRVAKRLVRLDVRPAGETLPAPGSALTCDGTAEAGKLTSVSSTPDGERVIGLAYLRSEHAQLGREVEIAGGGGARVVGLA